MKLKKWLMLAPLALMLAACGDDEPQPTVDKLPVYSQTHSAIISAKECDKVPVTVPEGGARYTIVNSSAELDNLPVGSIAPTLKQEFARTDFSKYTLVIVTSLIYVEPGLVSPTCYMTFYVPIGATRPTLALMWHNAVPVKAPIDNSYFFQQGFTTDRLSTTTDINIEESVLL